MSLCPTLQSIQHYLSVVKVIAPDKPIAEYLLVTENIFLLISTHVVRTANSAVIDRRPGVHPNTKTFGFAMPRKLCRTATTRSVKPRKNGNARQTPNLRRSLMNKA